jgi:hypothetical protein
MGNRVPRFETHIRPMIRALDRARMLSRFDLWSYQDVTNAQNLTLIRQRIGRATETPIHGEMPPSGFGGPWPFEWIDLFERWANAGCPRLEAVATGVTLVVAWVTSTRATLTAEGTNPDFGYATWLEPEFRSASPVRFSLYREPPEEIPPFGDLDFRASIDFEPGSAAEAFVNGAAMAIPGMGGPIA